MTDYSKFVGSTIIRIGNQLRDDAKKAGYDYEFYYNAILTGLSAIMHVRRDKKLFLKQVTPLNTTNPKDGTALLSVDFPYGEKNWRVNADINNGIYALFAEVFDEEGEIEGEKCFLFIFTEEEPEPTE